MVNPPDEVVEQLRFIGKELTRQAGIEVWRGGIVRPSESGAFSQSMGRGNSNGSERPRGSAAGSRKGTARRKGTAGGSGTTRSAAPVFVGSPREAYERQLTAVCAEYPGSQVWPQDRGLWLLAPSAVLEGLDRRALFLLAIPYEFEGRTASAWGFWDWNDPSSAKWIGPRHTNYPLGSICAYHLGDKVSWRDGGSLVTLLDFYSEWALRQLHLEYFGRWPGSQIASSTYERMVETHCDELCGCGSVDKTYAECHQAADLARDRVGLALSFMQRTNGGRRDPPVEVLEFLRGRRGPPEVMQLATVLPPESLLR